MFKLSQEDQVLWLLPVLRGLPWLGIKPALGATNSASFPRLSRLSSHGDILPGRGVPWVPEKWGWGTAISWLPGRSLSVSSTYAHLPGSNIGKLCRWR